MSCEVYHGDPKGTEAQIDAFNRGVRAGAFGLLLNSVLFSVPFVVTAMLTANLGGGQGLCTGVLDILIVVPQLLVPDRDQLFGRNTPAFALASAFAFVCGFLGLFIIPKLPRPNFRTSGMGGMH